MRKAFEQFMMSGKKASVSRVDVDAQTKSKDKDGMKYEVALKKMEKKYWQILNAFQGTLQRDWLEVDDNLEGVVSSISNLRSRIFMESKHLYKMKNKSTKKWNGHGYRADDVSRGLTTDDVELALSHDLLQHEKMMAGARMLLSSLSEGQEALGRRLDEFFLHHMNALYLTQQQPSDFDAEKTPPWVSVMNVVAEKLQDVYGSLALELYRKQLLVQSILDAVNDDMLMRNEDEDDDIGMDVNPRRVADRCLREWPRRSKASHVSVELLDGLLELGERSDK